MPSPERQRARARAASATGLPASGPRHRHRLDLDVGAPLISVDLQEHVADAQRHAVVVGKDDLDLIHVRHLRLTVPRRAFGDCRTASAVLRVLLL